MRDDRPRTALLRTFAAFAALVIYITFIARYLQAEASVVYYFSSLEHNHLLLFPSFGTMSSTLPNPSLMGIPDELLELICSYVSTTSHHIRKSNENGSFLARVTK